jgi:single-stranded-DNA-specific exonuclease
MWKVLADEKIVTTQNELISVLLNNRGVSPEDAEHFFAPSYIRDIHNPYELGDMQKAVDRVYVAVKNKQRIMVYGDYDADGITSTAIMLDVLESIGAHAVPYLPHRYDDGYGLNGDVLKQAQNEFDVLITVDCGIGNGAVVSMLQEFGKDVIIVDHHELPEEMPPAYAILHPRHPNYKYPFEHLCGAGTSFKFAQALLRHEDSPHIKDPDKEKWLLDLAMIGTIADVMPLLGENRAIVAFGKQILMRTKRNGLLALLKQARIDASVITAQDIAFRIIPLINAAGRIGHPQSALNALLAKTPEQAQVAVKELISLNNKRRSMTKDIMADALTHVDESLPFIFAVNATWHAGIVGLVAGRLSSQFGKPAFVLGGLPVERKAKHVVGSARGAGTINVMHALETVRHHTTKLGGHAGAAGFSVLHESVESMKIGLVEYFSSSKDAAQPEHLIADAVISEELVSWDTVRALQKFEPFGEANTEPVFVLKNVRAYNARQIGASKDHLKMTVSVGDSDVEAIGFGLGEKLLLTEKPLNILAKIGINEYKGRQSLELRLVDISND